MLTAVATEQEPPLPTATLVAILDQLLERSASREAAASKSTAKPNPAAVAADAGALRACAAAAAGLTAGGRSDADRAECYTRLPLLVTALFRCLWRQQLNGGGGATTAAAGEPAEALQAADVCEVITACVRPKMAQPEAAKLAASLRDALTPRYMPLWEVVLEACGALFQSLGPSAHPACGALLTSLAGMWNAKGLSDRRPMLIAALGQAAKVTLTQP